MEEIWKDIEGWEGLFRVSNLGNVYDIKKDELVKQYVDKKKHMAVYFRLGKRSFMMHSVHRLVAKAFVPNTDNKPHIHHIGHNPQNNRADNLMWVTAKEHRALHPETNQIERKSLWKRLFRK